MTSIPAPYAVSADPAARRWWDGLSDESRRALKRSWRDDERVDPLLPTARRVASFLNDCVLQPEPAERAWESVDWYEHSVELSVHRPNVYLVICSNGGGYGLFDQGMLWPLQIAAGRWEIQRKALSIEQHDLLSRQQASG
ncbi:hypothetical protein [Lysobacter enzymogenes]|uniref:Uncharacterized protein n=1 Tax=Lysobacter enzymogenes TaxID=69 RepID=A0AAU9AII8_LYSEN|nr:hypothetical protein [Lysobacter enzymogenes]BAV98910.1 conserved hypothetical protein [Lysobacter enzymogenes]